MDAAPMILACLRYQHNGPVSASQRPYVLEAPNLMLLTGSGQLRLPMLSLKPA